MIIRPSNLIEINKQQTEEDDVGTEEAVIGEGEEGEDGSPPVINDGGWKDYNPEADPELD